MSIKDIAKMTGLSSATVSHAINGTRQVSKESRDLIASAIEEIGYVPNNAAKALRTQKSSTVAMLIPKAAHGKTTNTFYMEVLSGAKEYLEKNNYSLIVVTYSEKQQVKELGELARQWIDGMLLIPNKSSYFEAIDVLKNNYVKTPFIMLDCSASDGVPGVYTDHVEAAAKGVNLLIKCDRKRIGYIGAGVDYFTGIDRLRGYKQALSDAEILFDEEIVHASGEYTSSNGYEACGKLVQKGIDGLFIADNNMTVGVMRYFLENNIKIREEISLVGFEDYEWMNITNPPITTIRQYPYLMGEKGAEILLKMLVNPDYCERVILPTELVLRQSH